MSYHQICHKKKLSRSPLYKNYYSNLLVINNQKWLLLNMCTVPNRNTTLVLLYYPGWGSTRVTAPARNNIECPPSLELLLHGLAPHLNDTQKCIVPRNDNHIVGSYRTVSPSHLLQSSRLLPCFTTSCQLVDLVAGKRAASHPTHKEAGVVECSQLSNK